LCENSQKSRCDSYTLIAIMTERISFKNEKKVYQPRIRASRIKDLREMKDFTKRPMTVLLDEALSLYLATFFSSPDYMAYQEAMWKKEEEAADDFEGPNNDDYENLDNWL
jgi:hypothetical protein